MILDTMIDAYLDTLLSHAEPGNTLHYALLVTGGPEARNALGFPISEKLQVTYAAIDCTGGEVVKPEQFIAVSLSRMITEADEEGLRIYFAGLAMEAWTLFVDGTAQDHIEAIRLQADGQLRSHPMTVETTRVYAACRDGRRWAAIRYHSGARAGETDGPDLRTGPELPLESGMHARLIRAAVGLR